ncbi:MAG: Nif11 family protein [Acutalibacteraceae bacterium]
MNKELISKEKECKSAEETLALAKENGYDITEEQAKEYFDKLHASGEIADEELDNVVGGCGQAEDYVNGNYVCDNFEPQPSVVVKFYDKKCYRCVHRISPSCLSSETRYTCRNRDVDSYEPCPTDFDDDD